MIRISPERLESNSLLRAWCAGVTGDVLSIGSGGDIDKEGRTYRQYFRQASSYTTSDIDPALGCDLLLDVRSILELNWRSYDAVFASGVLEHVDDVHGAVTNVHRLLREGGLFIVGVPFLQPIHRAPHDFWRFTEFGLRHLLRAFTIVDLKALGKPASPYGYWALARKEARHG